MNWHRLFGLLVEDKGGKPVPRKALCDRWIHQLKAWCPAPRRPCATTRNSFMRSKARNGPEPGAKPSALANVLGPLPAKSSTGNLPPQGRPGGGGQAGEGHAMAQVVKDASCLGRVDPGQHGDGAQFAQSVRIQGLLRLRDQKNRTFSAILRT